MKFKAILIDMDGTLTDTESIYQVNWVKAARELGYDFFTREDALFLRSAWAPYAEEHFREKYGDKMDYDKLRCLCNDITAEELKQIGVPLKPYAKEFLEALKKTDLKIVLVSSTRMENVIKRLKETELYDYFEEIISAYTTKRGKPFPEPYLYACEVIGVDPKETIAVEDSPNGVMSAVSAGCNTIMVPDITEADDELKAGLFGYAKDLMEVLDIIEQ
ncbi:MAG: HAD family phosphatase [Lachnospiraceae bacterium]|nr:HAD family phosphatase [Lachnospiraceae bacterium]